MPQFPRSDTDFAALLEGFDVLCSVSFGGGGGREIVWKSGLDESS